MENFNLETKKKQRHGVGIRHLLMLLTAFCATIIYVMRSSMGMIILGMTDTTKSNSITVDVYSWPIETQSFILSSFFWGYTVMQIPAGVLVQRFGGKPMILSTLAINGVLCLVAPVLTKIGGWIALCLVRMTMGVTIACFNPSVHMLLGRWAPPQERARLSVIACTGNQLGAFITMPLCALLLQSSLGWTQIFYTVGALASIAAVVWWAFAGSTPRKHQWVKPEERKYIENSLNSSGKPCPPIPWRCILTSGPLRATAVAHIGVNWGFIAFTQMHSYSRLALGFRLNFGLWILALPYVGEWITSLIAGVLSDYLNDKKILSLSECRKLFNTIGCVGAGLGLITISFLTREDEVLAMIVMIFTNGMLGFCTCGVRLNHIDLSPNFGGVLFAITNCIANLFGVLMHLSKGFIIGDYIVDTTGWRKVFFLAASIIICGDMVFRFFGTSELQTWNEPIPDHDELVEEKTKKNSTDEKMVLEVVNKFQESNANLE